MKKIIFILICLTFLFQTKAQVHTISDIELVFEVGEERGMKLATANITIEEDIDIEFDHEVSDTTKDFYIKIGSVKTNLNSTGHKAFSLKQGDKIKIKMENGPNSGKIFNLTPGFIGQLEPFNWDLFPVGTDLSRFENIPPGTNGFCEYGVSRNNFEWIQSMKIGDDFVNNSGRDVDAHGNYKVLGLLVNSGDTLDLELIPGYRKRKYNEHWRIWIDFNKDTDFFDEGELIFQQNGVDTLKTKLIIPEIDQTGQFSMKVAMRWKRHAPACGFYSTGEIEDYSIIIVAD